jgi:hypothetical protein
VTGVRSVQIWLVAGVALVAGACSSAAPRTRSAPSTTTPAGPKLQLAAPEAARDALGGAPSSFPVRPTRYVLDAPLPGLGNDAPVRRMTGHRVSAADAQRFAQELGIDAIPSRTADGYEVLGANATLRFAMVSGTVQVSYSPGAQGDSGGSAGSSAGSVGPGTGGAGASGAVTKAPPVSTAPAPPPTIAQPVDVPSARDAQAIAGAVLDRLGVLAGTQWSTEVADSGVTSSVCAEKVSCPTAPPVVLARTVTFRLVLDGVRVQGVEWSITLGEHRRVESLTGEWASPEPVGTYPLRSTAGVFDDLQHGRARYASPQPMLEGASAAEAPASGSSPTIPPVVVHITAVSLGIARWDAYDHGGTLIDLVPTYRFRARVEAGSPYDIELLALDPRTVEFTKPVPAPEGRSVPVPMPAPAQGAPTPPAG